jgi:hypothetical protein
MYLGLCIRRITTKNGKVRANFFTEMASYAGCRFLYKRRMISLSVKLIGHLQNPAGTKFHTKATSFTPAFDNMDLCRWQRFLPQIKRLSPHLHGNNPALKLMN